MEPVLVALPSQPESIWTALARVSWPPWVCMNQHLQYPWAAPAAWAGLESSAAPGKGSWVQLSLRQLLAAGGTQSISSLLQFK